ncbi:mitochondrial pyruvate carrier 2-like isoform X1 [Drosophila bipectinata]|uniref:mitochondrial pyruvate carrier 2-like isoform X1 n=1 Tax=Drosophila bipectinata TaxID=42026 RepID=UPI001C8A69C2|nr:mitochondrial pyruvate carrier 2-like isoform X1 [Drosophila bipectinata]
MSKGMGLLSKLYNAIVTSVDKFVPNRLKPFWESPAGPKTVFFWGPTFKWLLVAAGVGDVINRPPQLISLNQCTVLAVTGLIYSRFSMVIIPKNYNLLAVNLTVAGIQSYLIFKHLKWRSENKGNVDFEYPNHYRNPDEFW